MRKLFGIIVTITLLSSLIILTTCSEKIATVGNLHIIVMDTVGMPVPTWQVYISSSWQDQKAGLHSASAWTDANGQTYFDDLAPGYYWYSAEGWTDYGAVKVLAGEDMHVYLWLNSHQKK